MVLTTFLNHTLSSWLARIHLFPTHRSTTIFGEARNILFLCFGAGFKPVQCGPSRSILPHRCSASTLAAIPRTRDRRHCWSSTSRSGFIARLTITGSDYHVTRVVYTGGCNFNNHLATRWCGDSQWPGRLSFGVLVDGHQRYVTRGA